MTDPNLLRKRLLFQSKHLGTKENDLLLGPFAATALADMDLPQLQLFDAFLQEQDQQIYAWLVQNVTAPEQYQGLIRAIGAHNTKNRHAS